MVFTSYKILARKGKYGLHSCIVQCLAMPGWCDFRTVHILGTRNEKR